MDELDFESGAADTCGSIRKEVYGNGVEDRATNGACFGTSMPSLVVSEMRW